jgi:hypothetical protein
MLRPNTDLSETVDLPPEFSASTDPDLRHDPDFSPAV